MMFCFFRDRYNIRYGRVAATDEDVDQAAKAADIHEKVLTLKDGKFLNNPNML